MRTRAYWEGIIATALAGFGLSNSAVAVWKLFRDIAITIAMTLDGIFLIHRDDTNTALATKQYGSLPWYSSMAKAFQYGDSMIVTDGVVSYAADNPAARIVTQAAVKELDDEVIVVKLAKTVAGVLTPLSGPELTAFKTYLTARKVPGMRVNAVSTIADEVDFALAILFNARFDQTALAAAVATALASFCDAFAFDAILRREKLLQAIMAVPGVENVTGVITVNYSTGGSATLTDSLELPAGYFNYDGAAIPAITYTPIP